MKQDKESSCRIIVTFGFIIIAMLTVFPIRLAFLWFPPTVSAPEKDVDLVDVSAIEPDGMRGFGGHVLEREEVVGHLRGSRHFRGALETQQQQVQHQAEELHDEGGELQTANDAVRVGVIHVLVVDDHVVFGRHVIGDVVVHDQTEQSGIQKRREKRLLRRETPIDIDTRISSSFIK